MPTLRLLGAALVLAGSLAAQTEDHAIDRAAKSCLERAASPAALSDCSRKAAAEWHAEVDRLVTELSALLDVESRTALKTSQADWTRYAKTHQIAIERIHSRSRNPGASIMSAEDAMEVPRQRARELQRYIDLLKQTAP